MELQLYDDMFIFLVKHGMIWIGGHVGEQVVKIAMLGEAVCVEHVDRYAFIY